MQKAVRIRLMRGRYCLFDREIPLYVLGGVVEFEGNVGEMFQIQVDVITVEGSNKEPEGWGWFTLAGRMFYRENPSEYSGPYPWRVFGDPPNYQVHSWSEVCEVIPMAGLYMKKVQ